jgi:hypothetical protein
MPIPAYAECHVWRWDLTDGEPSVSLHGGIACRRPPRNAPSIDHCCEPVLVQVPLRVSPLATVNLKVQASALSEPVTVTV